MITMGRVRMVRLGDMVQGTKGTTNAIRSENENGGYTVHEGLYKFKLRISYGIHQ